MALVIPPDHISAVIERLRSFSELQALTSSAAGWSDGRTGQARISGERHLDWKMPTQSIIVQSGGGFEDSLDDIVASVDLRCYGSTGVNAAQVYRNAYAAMCPPAPSGISRGFKLVNCMVRDIELSAGPFALIEPNQPSWHLRLATFRVRFSAVPVA